MSAEQFYKDFGADGRSGGEYGPSGAAALGGGSGGGQVSAEYQAQIDALEAEAQGVGPDSYAIDVPDTTVHTREVTDDERSSVQLDRITDPNSPFSKRAIQFGKDFSAGRGLMNSSIGGGNAFGAWIDRAQPFALQDAQTYGRTASENMGARNTGAIQDSGNELQSQIAETGFNAQRDSDDRKYKYGSATDLRRALLNIESREDSQAFTAGQSSLDRKFTAGESSLDRALAAGEGAANRAVQMAEGALNRSFSASERAAIQAFQTGERIDSQNFSATQLTAVQAFQAAQTQVTNDFQWQRDQLDANLQMAGIAQADRAVWLQAWTMTQSGQFSSIGNAASAIYSNTNMTAAQQQQAIQNMMTFFGGIAPQMPPPPTYEFGLM